LSRVALTPSGSAQGEPQLAGVEVGQQVELLGEGLEQVPGGLAVVVVALAGLGHGHHQVLVEVAAEAVGGGGDAPVGELAAQLGDARRHGESLVGVAVGQQDHPGQPGLPHELQQVPAAGLPAAVQVGHAALVDGFQGAAQNLAVGHRLDRDEDADMVVELDQGGPVVGLEPVDDVGGAALGFVQGFAGHGAGAVDDQGQVIGRAFPRQGGIGVRRLDAHQHLQALGVAGDECALEGGEEDAGSGRGSGTGGRVVVGHDGLRSVCGRTTLQGPGLTR
jgi:hypothetical protein